MASSSEFERIFERQVSWKRARVVFSSVEWLRNNLEQHFRAPGGSTATPEQHFRTPRGSGGMLEQHFRAPSGSAVALEQHFRAPGGSAVALEQHFRSPSGSGARWSIILSVLAGRCCVLYVFKRFSGFESEAPAQDRRVRAGERVRRPETRTETFV